MFSPRLNEQNSQDDYHQEHDADHVIDHRRKGHTFLLNLNVEIEFLQLTG